jgi:cbb3-type cytochrome oxidase maturation protein
MASFQLEESLRPGTLQALQALAAEGLQLSLLTGDAPERAQALAQRLQLSDWRAHATPELKLAALTQAQQAGRAVAMVGDGINDAPVLARADVSLAMGQGALVARSQADAVITSNDLRDLVHARRTAQRAVRIVRQNMVWAAVYNATCIPLALVGWLPPWAAGLGMAASSLWSSATPCVPRAEAEACAAMESLYLLIPLSALLVLLIIAVFGWAVHRGQFEELEGEAERILTDEAGALDGRQGRAAGRTEES